MKGESCECVSWCIEKPELIGRHHHYNCPRFSSEKFSYLMYWHGGIDAWMPVIDPSFTVIVEEDLLDGESTTIEVKRCDMTDKEFNDIPEADQ